MYWRRRFSELPITDFCSVIQTNSHGPAGKCRVDTSQRAQISPPTPSVYLVPTLLSLSLCKVQCGRRHTLGVMSPTSCDKPVSAGPSGDETMLVEGGVYRTNKA